MKSRLLPGLESGGNRAAQSKYKPKFNHRYGLDPQKGTGEEIEPEKHSETDQQELGNVEEAPYFQEKPRISKEEEEQIIAKAKRDEKAAQIAYLQLQRKLPHKETESREIDQDSAGISPSEEKSAVLRSNREKTAAWRDYESRMEQIAKSIGSPRALTREEHEKYMRKVRRERKERDLKHKSLLEQTVKKIMEEEAREKEEIKARAEILKQQRKDRAEASLEKEKEEHRKLMEQEEYTNKLYEEARKKKSLHQLIEERYRDQVVIPRQKQAAEVLKKKEQENELNIQKLLSHEKKYLLTKNRQDAQSEPINPIDESNTSHLTQDLKTTPFRQKYHPPSKSEHLKALLKIEEKQKKDMLTKHQKLVNQLLRKQEEFSAYVRYKLPPTLDQRKQEEMVEKIALMKSPRRETGDSRQIGIGYLAEAKLLAKSHSKTKEQAEIPVQPGKKQLGQNKSTKTDSGSAKSHVLPRLLEGSFEKIRRNRIEAIVSSKEIASAEKVKKLRVQAEVVDEQIKRKEQLLNIIHDQKAEEQQLECLLSSIKAKISIIKVCNGGPTQDKNQPPAIINSAPTQLLTETRSHKNTTFNSFLVQTQRNSNHTLTSMANHEQISY